MITVTNDFHNTQVTLRAREGEALTDSQIRRARRELCGVAGCMCGGAIGERGTQDYEVLIDGAGSPYLARRES